MHLPIIIAQDDSTRIVLTELRNGRVTLVFESKSINAMKETVWLNEESQDSARIRTMLVQELLKMKQQNMLQEQCITWFYRAALVSALKQIISQKLDQNISKDKEWAAFA